jgi:sugar/nucleoside kinase (ribokinase family)
VTVDVVGSTTADISLRVRSFPAGTETEFGGGSLVIAPEAARLSVGGNAGRTAQLLALLGASVRLHTSLGDDPWGRWIEEQLVASGVHVVAAAGGRSSTNCVATDDEGRRMSFFHPSPVDLAAALPSADSALLLVAACPLRFGSDLEKLLQRFHDFAVPTVLDPGPALGERRDPRDLAALAPYVDQVTMNEAECLDLAGTSAIEESVARLHALGVRSLVVKLGCRGAIVSDETSDRPATIPTEALAPVSGTVGAGDCFNAGFALGIVRRLGSRPAAALGNRIAGEMLRVALDPARLDAAALLRQLETDFMNN